MLKIENLHVSYGGIQALRGISLEVPDGKIVTLIGANGAGKSTTLRTITGLVKASAGSILWNGQELLGQAHRQDRLRRHRHEPRGAPGLRGPDGGGESEDRGPISAATRRRSRRT